MAYPGGKGGAGVAQLIINQQPPHGCYIEPFLGGGSVMRLKRRAHWNLGLDLDFEAVSVFRAGLDDRDGFTLSAQCGIAFLETDACELYADTLIYCDPPYMRGTRRSDRDLYRHEMTDADHARLLLAITSLHCMVQISGYESPLYMKMLQGWRLIRYRKATRRGSVEECLWMNYPEPTALHDWRFLGDDFRERERIKRKTARWIARIGALPLLERTALLSAMASSLASSDERVPRPGPLAGSDDCRSRSRSTGSGDRRRPTSAALAMRPALSPDLTRAGVGDRTAPEMAVL